MTPAIDARDVFRIYSTPEGDAAALQGLTLRVREREVLVVLGPSGSGKTTLLRILAGFDVPSAGTVHVFGVDLAKLSGHRFDAYRSQTLGYIDQHYSRSLSPELSARELIAFQLGLDGEARRAARSRADELLERVGLADRADSRPAELSGGEQQRVAVCAALAHRPRLLLADEPTGELDAANAALIYELIGELAREERCTTVIVSHDPESAAIADRIVRIRDGRVSEEMARDDGEDAIVVGRGGWVRLPEELLLRTGISVRARARVRGPGILLLPAAPTDETASSQVAPQVVDPGRAAAPERRQRPDEVVAELRAATKRFGNPRRPTTVFNRFDASFRRGTFTVVTGPSGSGKTTLLHLLAGLEQPDDGECIVLGAPLSAMRRAARADLRRGHIALVGQEPGLMPFLSARENVDLGLALRQGHGNSERALEVLAAVGLAERSEQRVSRLSAGERERVAVARALAPELELLLADEPTARLDQANALGLAALFARMVRESGTTIVCATHDPLVIEQADDEIALSAALRPEARPPAGAPVQQS
jgi:ABC-type lipoprotein export system ATPase subunit